MSTENNWENSPKAPLASGVKVFNKAERDEMRQGRAFKSRNMAWSKGTVIGTRVGFGSPKRVGKMSEITAMAGNAGVTTLKEFSIFYLENVCSWETVQAQAKEWFDYCIANDIDITPSEALAEHIVHIIDQSWEGWERETTAMEALNEFMGTEIIRPDYRWDVGYAIDLVKIDETAPDGFLEGYQVKPARFFDSQNPGVVWSRKDNVIRHQKAEALGKKVYFVNGDRLHNGEVELIHWSEMPEFSTAA